MWPPSPGGGTADSELSKSSALAGVRVRIPPRASERTGAVLERHLAAALAARARRSCTTALLEVQNGLLNQRPRGPGALLAPRPPARSTFCEPRCGMLRQARGQEGQDQDDDAEGDDSGDDHGLAIPCRGGGQPAGRERVNQRWRARRRRPGSTGPPDPGAVRPARRTRRSARRRRGPRRSGRARSRRRGARRPSTRDRSRRRRSGAGRAPRAAAGRRRTACARRTSAS